MAKAPARNKRRADRVIAFIECLTVPSGEGAGGPFWLRPWQKRFIRKIYEPTDRKTGNRLVRRAIFSVARKNGKTALIAALVLAHLIGPESELNGEIYSAANEREQAAITFKVAAQIVRADPELLALVNIVDSTKTMTAMQTGSVYRAISAEAGSKHGQNASVVIYDELAQAKRRDLYDVLDTSFGARAEPLMIVISTQSNDPQHIMSQLLDDGLSANDPTTVAELYAVPDDADPWDERNWKLANPALGDFRSLADVRAKASQARRLPSFEPAFRNLYLNQRADARSPLIPRAEWLACRSDEPGGLLRGAERVYLGLDLSGTTDLTALVGVSAEDGVRVQAWHWKPADLLDDHQVRDRTPYAEWRRLGWLETPPGRAIDYGWVAERIGEIHADYEVVGLAFDRWRIESLLKELRTVGVDAWIDGKDDPIYGGLRLVPWGQGFRDMAPAIDALEAAILSREFQHDGNLALQACFASAHALTDPAGNRKLDKTATRFRIDGAVATAMAVGLRARDSAVVEDDAPQLIIL